MIRAAPKLPPLRPRLPALPRAPRVPHPDVVALEYARELVAVAEAVSTELRAAFLPALGGLLREAEGLRLDADDPRKLSARARQVAKIMTADAETKARRAAARTDVFVKNQLRALSLGQVGVDVFATDPDLRALNRGFVRENVQLIQSLADDQIGEVEGIVQDAVERGRRHETVAKEIEARFGIAERRAALIARDQIGTANAKLTEARQRAAGVDRYRWQTSQDSRVRDEHEALEGTIHSWDDPPPSGPRGERMHPGEPINCRCNAVPVLDDIYAQLAAGEDIAPAQARAPERSIEAPRPVPVQPAPAFIESRAPSRGLTDSLESAMRTKDSARFHQSVQELRSDLVERYGLREALPIEATVIDEEHPSFHLAHGLVNVRDGVTKLEVGYNSELRTAVHETLHATGGSFAGGVKLGPARNLEEVTTETLTRHYLGAGDYVRVARPASADLPLMERLASLKEDSQAAAAQIGGGSYSAWRARVVLSVGHATGNWDGRSLQRTLENVSMLWKRRAYRTSDEGLDAFIDLLNPPSNEARRFYRAAFDTKWGASGGDD